MHSLSSCRALAIHQGIRGIPLLSSYTLWSGRKVVMSIRDSWQPFQRRPLHIKAWQATILKKLNESVWSHMHIPRSLYGPTRRAELAMPFLFSGCGVRSMLITISTRGLGSWFFITFHMLNESSGMRPVSSSPDCSTSFSPLPQKEELIFFPRKVPIHASYRVPKMVDKVTVIIPRFQRFLQRCYTNPPHAPSRGTHHSISRVESGWRPARVFRLGRRKTFHRGEDRHCRRGCSSQAELAPGRGQKSRMESGWHQTQGWKTYRDSITATLTRWNVELITIITATVCELITLAFFQW